MFKESTDITINLTITARCYARCKGCINSSMTFCSGDFRDLSDLESDPARDVRLIIKIAQRYPDKGVTVCFYGGEPFLHPEKMDQVRRLLEKSAIGSRVRYMVYTTGEFIGASVSKYPDLIQDMWLYSISVDGSKRQHESVRPGTSLEKTLSNLETLRRVYRGPVLAWSTLREEQSLLDCFQQFMSMRERGLADHFFWHWADAKQPFEHFEKYSRDYRADLEEIMTQYVSSISRGDILPISHINELLLYRIEGRQRGHTACAVELAQNYDILGGQVHACADLPHSLGASSADGSVDINPQKLKSLTAYKGKLGCSRCIAHWYCGGRCPVQAIVGSPERTGQICQLVRLHVNTVEGYIPQIRKNLEKYNITAQDLYDRSAFIAKYTDVVP